MVPFFWQWACDQGYKKVVAVGADYTFGYESVGGFQKAFEDCGGKIIQKIWPTLGNKDFGPYITTIKADADAVFSLMVGPMAAQFPKQLRAAGFKKAILGGGTSYDEFAPPFMADDVIGDVSALHYSAALETPANEAFVQKYRAKYGKVPSYFSESNYTTAKMIHEVMKKTLFGYDKPELWNTVIKTYPNVSQFWTYGKETFLKQPVYSREFPPCKFCE